MLTTETSTETAISALNSILRGEISAVEAYEQALEKVSDTEARETLEEGLQSHEQRVERLYRLIQVMGGQPSEGSGAWGAFTRLFEGGAKLLGDEVAVAALEEGEDHGLKEYREALEKVDVESRRVLESELLPAQERTHAALSALKKRLKMEEQLH